MRPAIGNIGVIATALWKIRLSSSSSQSMRARNHTQASEKLSPESELKILQNYDNGDTNLHAN